MIRSIELINWKTHKQSVLEFKKGVNVLIGIMGAGKSSVTDAISYALFGTFPMLNQKRVNTSDMITNRPAIEEFSQIKLIFEIEKNIYTITRKIKRTGGASEARIDKNGEYLQTQPERVTEVIQQLLKIDYDTFARAIYAHQNQLEYFLDLAKAERKRGIDQMLGLDSFSTAYDNATALLTNIKSQIESEQRFLETVQIATLKEALLKLQGEIESDKMSIQLIEKQKIDNEQIAAKLRIEFLALKDALLKKKSAQEAMIQFTTRINSIQEEITAIEALGIDPQKVVGLFEEMKEKERVLDKELIALIDKDKLAIKEISLLDFEIKKSKEDIAIRDRLHITLKGKDIDNMQKQLAQLEDTLGDEKAKVISCNDRIKESRKWLLEIEAHMDICPLCEQNLQQSSRAHIIQKRKDMIKELDEEVKRSEVLVSNCQKNMAILKSDLDAAKKAADKIKEYGNIDDALLLAQQKKDIAQTGYDALSKSIVVAQAELKALRSEIDKLKLNIDKLKLLETYRVKINEQRKMLELYKEQFDSVKADQKEAYMMQDSIGVLDAKIAQAQATIEGTKKRIDVSSRQLVEKQLEEQRYISAQHKIESKQNIIANMNNFKTALIETQSQLRANLVDTVNTIMHSLWNELYPYGDYRSIRLKANSDDYLLEMDVGEGNWVAVDNVSSGGERSIACLTMRIALSMVIVPNLRWIILDEPTHNIDSNGISKMIEVLGGKLPANLDQIFIITHEDAMKQIIGASVHLLDRDKSKSAHTNIAPL